MNDAALMEDPIRSKIRTLPFWQGPLTLTSLIGGLCNKNFVAENQSRKFVVRVGEDIPVHGISQASVENAMRAAAGIEVSPALRYANSGISISDFIDGRHLLPSDLENEMVLAGLVSRLRELHQSKVDIGPLTYFWPFQVVRKYVRFCRDRSSLSNAELDLLSECASSLEHLVSPFLPVFTHNDVVPQNAMLDVNGRVYLIDWDYGAYGHPFFDLAGITANADIDAGIDAKVLELYAGSANSVIWKQFRIFKLIVNMREMLWGAVQELTSKLDSERVEAGMASIYPDEERGYAGYTELNRKRFHRNLAEFKTLYG
ncbi:MAG: choline/ethanolamine kinase family protein [Hyphomicrobium sp.]|uniref:phosphotransferase n=1 Tax=Hyphomicrobium sp. TaxID=82 RepID=UPI0039E48DB7